MLFVFMHIAIIRAALTTAPDANGKQMPVYPNPNFQIALGHAILAPLFIFASGPGSGGHIVSTVTLATTFTGHTSWFRCLFYFIAQQGGAIMGAVLFRAAAGWGANGYASLGGCGLGDVTPSGAVLSEFSFTFAIFFVGASRCCVAGSGTRLAAGDGVRGAVSGGRACRLNSPLTCRFRATVCCVCVCDTRGPNSVRRRVRPESRRRKSLPLSLAAVCRCAKHDLIESCASSALAPSQTYGPIVAPIFIGIILGLILYASASMSPTPGYTIGTQCARMGGR